MIVKTDGKNRNKTLKNQELLKIEYTQRQIGAENYKNIIPTRPLAITRH